MTSMRRALRSRLHIVRHDDRGLTLAELMVTMVLMAIVGSVMLTAVVSVTKTVTRNQANSDSVDVARVGMNRMAKSIRSGMEIVRSGTSNQPALDEIGPNKMIVFASLGASPTETTYTIDASRNLIETKRVAGGTSPYWTFTGAGVATTIASKIPSGAPALFVFLDGSGVALATQTSTDELVLAQVRQVRITLTVDVDPTRGGGPVTLTNTVVLPNLGVAKR